MRKIYFRLCLVFFVLVQATLSSYATIYTTTATGGNWNNAASYTAGSGFPGAGDDVIIVSGATLTINGNRSVNNITILLGGTLACTGNNTLHVYGNFTNNGTMSLTNGFVEFDGTGLQTISGSTCTFYDLTVLNTFAATPSIASSVNLTVTDQLDFTSGNLDLEGNTFFVTTATPTTNLLSGGTIISSVAGAHFTVTDPDTELTMHFFGTWIGNQSQGITISVTASQIEFLNFVEYGTASFTKDGDGTSNQFGGGNGFHGPVTFTSYRTTGLWKFGVSTIAPDTFYNATLNAGGNATGNDNFIFGANNTETFNGTTTVTSTTPGGVYFGRSNGTGNANITFNGPVICTISLTGNVTFADADVNNQNSVTFNSTIQLNSTASSTGYYYFGNSTYSTITLSPTGQFVGTGTLLGKSNTYLENVTQNGTTLTQTINTAGSTGFLEIGGKTSAPGRPCTFNAPCVFTADTAGYIVSATFNATAPLTFTVNHPSANGYLLNNTFNGNVTATIGEMRVQNNTFGVSGGGTTVSLTETNTIAADSSVQNGGNIFNVPTTIINTGNAFLFFSTTASDYFNSDVTFTINSNAVMGTGTKYKTHFRGNITINGSVSVAFYMGYYYSLNNGGVIIDGSGTQVMSLGGVVTTPIIKNFAIDMTGAGPNIFEFSNFNPSIFAGTFTFTAGNTGLINLNGNTLTLGYDIITGVIGTISYPSAGTGATAGWIYNGTFVRSITTATIGYPTAGGAVATAGFFPMGSSPTLNVFQPFWFANNGGTVSSAGTISVSQTSNANWFTSITPYNDATWSGGTSVIARSNANWIVSYGGGLALSATAKIMFGGFGFQTFVDADVNASYATSTVATYAAPVNIYNAATDVEVERTGLTLAQMAATWYIGTKNVTASPLPIQLASFTAQCNNYAADLKWTTATETDNNFFTVDKTQDGYNFVKVIDVKGAGTSTTPHEYSITDETPYTTTSYYRLSQTNLDGTTSIAGTAVYIPCENENIVNSFSYNHCIKVEINSVEASNYTIDIFNSLGQQIFNQTVNASQGLNTYSLNSISTEGIYIVHVTGINGSYSKKLAIGL